MTFKDYGWRAIITGLLYIIAGLLMGLYALKDTSSRVIAYLSAGLVVWGIYTLLMRRTITVTVSRTSPTASVQIKSFSSRSLHNYPISDLEGIVSKDIASRIAKYINSN